jgi:hypothetical protein
MEFFKKAKCSFAGETRRQWADGRATKTFVRQGNIQLNFGEGKKPSYTKKKKTTNIFVLHSIWMCV